MAPLIFARARRVEPARSKNRQGLTCYLPLTSSRHRSVLVEHASVSLFFLPDYGIKLIFIHPSICFQYLLLPELRVTGLSELLPAVIGRKDKWPVYRRATLRQTTICTHTHTTDIYRFLSHLTCLFLDRERKTGNLEGAKQTQGEHANSTQKHCRAGIKLAAIF